MCISYSDVIYFFTREKRRSYLLGALSFECACIACSDVTNDPVSISNSGENRKMLKHIAIELKHRVDSTLYNAGM